MQHKLDFSEPKSNHIASVQFLHGTAVPPLGPSQKEQDDIFRLFDERKYEEIRKLAGTMVEKYPEHGLGWKSLGAALLRLNVRNDAIVAMQKAIELAPVDAEAHFNLGIALHERGQLPEAETCYRRALKIDPTNADISVNLGGVLKQLSRLSEAEALYRQILESDAENAGAHNNLAIVLQDQNQPAKAEAHFRRALAIRPDFADAYSNLLFLLAYCGVGTADQYLRDARGWEQAVIPPEVRDRAKQTSLPRSSARDVRLRIGYISGDFKQHPVGEFIAHVLEHHDRKRVEVSAYTCSTFQDSTTQRIRRNVDQWRELTGVTDETGANLIRADRIDVLIDLAGHTAGNRLGIFARRAAPVQCGYLGYFASTGLTEMDYWIGDSVVTPESDDHHYSERVWRLPRAWIAYFGSDDAPAPEYSTDGRIRLGSFNHLGKITEATLDLWAETLRSLPNASLVLKTRELDDLGSKIRIAAAFQDRGIPSNRLELLGKTKSWHAHMSLYNCLDVALDPIGGIGGATTTCDALWMGVPVVTRTGSRYGERMSSAIVTWAGHSEWCVQKNVDYVTKVADLAADTSLRARLKASLRDEFRRTSLLDPRGLARALEDAYFAMHDTIEHT
jgi:protein O-GlcNAc transferase